MKTRLIILVSTCRPRFVARSAERDFRDPVIGTTMSTKGDVNENSISNNSAKHLLKLIVIIFIHLFTNLYKLCDELVFISGDGMYLFVFKMLFMTILKENLCFISAQRKGTLSRHTSSGTAAAAAATAAAATAAAITEEAATAADVVDRWRHGE